MKILLTGGNGLLGHHLIKALLQQGYEVHAIVRRAAGLYIQDAGLTVFEGNCLDENELQQAAEGCQAIIHAAAATDVRLSNKTFETVNVGGAQTIVKVAALLNISTIIFISTANTIGYGNATRKGKEEDAMEFPFTASYYAQSKLKAEEVFRKEAQLHPEKHIIILNPGFMIGSYDTRPSSGVLLKAAYKKLIMLAPKGGKCFICCQDVADAVVVALSKGQNGERYFLGNFRLSIQQFYELQKQILNYRQLILELPLWLLLPFGYLGDFLRFLGCRILLSSNSIRQLCVMPYYDNSKVVRELQLQSTPIEVAIKECMEWMQKQKPH